MNNTESIFNQEIMRFSMTDLEVLRPFLEEIRESFLFMTLDVIGQTNRFINKQIIDCIMNYFFENQVGQLLKPVMSLDSLKKVKRAIEDAITCDEEKKYKKSNLPKYMIFLNAYVDKVQQFGLQGEYICLLYDIILQEIQEQIFSEEWMTLCRKKITAALLLGHIKCQDRMKVNDIFNMWSIIFPQAPLKKVKLNFKVKSKIQEQQSQDKQKEKEVYGQGEKNLETKLDLCIEKGKDAIKIKKKKRKNSSIQNQKSSSGLKSNNIVVPSIEEEEETKFPLGEHIYKNNIEIDFFQGIENDSPEEEETHTQSYSACQDFENDAFFKEGLITKRRKGRKNQHIIIEKENQGCARESKAQFNNLNSNNYFPQQLQRQESHYLIKTQSPQLYQSHQFSPSQLPTTSHFQIQQASPSLLPEIQGAQNLSPSIYLNFDHYNNHSYSEPNEMYKTVERANLISSEEQCNITGDNNCISSSQQQPQQQQQYSHILRSISTTENDIYRNVSIEVQESIRNQQTEKSNEVLFLPTESFIFPHLSTNPTSLRQNQEQEIRTQEDLCSETL